MWTARRARLLLARAVLALAAGGVAPATMALDLDRLWDFRQPAVSEQRFREALATAQGDDALILHTQIARSFGLRRDFERAREVLRVVQPSLATAGPEARVRHGLEWGRTYVSATHPRGSVTEADRAEARRAWAEAEQRARAAALARLDTLPAGRTICHGDMHPGNVLMTSSGPVVATPDDEKALAEEQQRAAEAEAQRMQTSGS